MTLDEYNTAMQKVWHLEQAARIVQAEASRLEQETWNKAGLECHNREPGFPCWIADGTLSYHNTPEMALKAKLLKEYEKKLEM